MRHGALCASNSNSDSAMARVLRHSVPHTARMFHHYAQTLFSCFHPSSFYPGTCGFFFRCFHLFTCGTSSHCGVLAFRSVSDCASPRKGSLPPSDYWHQQSLERGGPSFSSYRSLCSVQDLPCLQVSSSPPSTASFAISPNESSDTWGCVSSTILPMEQACGGGQSQRDPFVASFRQSHGLRCDYGQRGDNSTRGT
jgi:hypothetical protein